MKEYPVINTLRFTLCGFTLDDAKEVQHLAGDKDVASTTLRIPHPYLDGMAEEWISKHQAEFHAERSVTFAIRKKNSESQLIGAIGLELHPEHEKAELGYWIGKPYWGQGYATEAAEAVLRYGFESLHLNRIEAYHFTRNLASGRVLQKIGMVHEGHLRQGIKKWGVFEDGELYAILKSDFKTYS